MSKIDDFRKLLSKYSGIKVIDLNVKANLPPLPFATFQTIQTIPKKRKIKKTTQIGSSIVQIYSVPIEVNVQVDIYHSNKELLYEETMKFINLFYNKKMEFVREGFAFNLWNEFPEFKDGTFIEKEQYVYRNIIELKMNYEEELQKERPILETIESKFIDTMNNINENKNIGG